MANLTPLRVLRLIDGKPGHESQSLGLASALARLTAVETGIHDVRTESPGWGSTLLKRSWCPPQFQNTPPDLAIGAGSTTHPALIGLGRHPKVRTVLLMSPPLALARAFDLCIVPEHDNRKGKNIISTTGALNPILPASNANPHRGLLLIGGPSKHHDWHAASILAAIQNILAVNPEVSWVATNSRRTPPETARALAKLAQDHKSFRFCPVEETQSGWVAQQLQENGLVWTTEDSVSMVYEALSSGARVGLLPVPRRRSNSRIVAGIDRCLQRGWLVPYCKPTPDLAACPPGPSLCEADRVAEFVLARLFPDRPG